ncbi:MAG: Multicomponent Na+:H+ antiporter subunit F [uncultured Sulfurovum sp.]|uniref:Multicomponent Na+:H+ antiporter subunit F n=1 Tax=uncultured Sulfurovum sp. TaxID=269237 RepID=A0A6S6SWM1_9BACT|nr:MAG: Multicomponent Na+:H+ antiporter subunit F [uncultured Sulfurovum sp.]
MQTVLVLLAMFLMLNLVVGMWRILRGPTTADLMLATQLFGTIAVAILLVLAEVSNQTNLLDVALIFALLSAVTAVAFVRRTDPKESNNHDID